MSSYFSLGGIYSGYFLGGFPNGFPNGFPKLPRRCFFFGLRRLWSPEKRETASWTVFLRVIPLGGSKPSPQLLSLVLLSGSCRISPTKSSSLLAGDLNTGRPVKCLSPCISLCDRQPFGGALWAFCSSTGSPLVIFWWVPQAGLPPRCHLGLSPGATHSWRRSQGAPQKCFFFGLRKLAGAQEM